MNRIAGIFCFFLLLCGATSADPVPGDINGDGTVNFADFLILANNFGKTGDPPAPDTLKVTVFDTVKVSDTLKVTVYDTIPRIFEDTTRVTIVVAEAREPASDQEIPRLALISVSGFFRNWDSDAEDDGIAVSITTRDATGGLIFSHETPDNIPLSVELTLHTDNDRDDKADQPPIYSGKYEGTSADLLEANISMIRIPVEQIKVDSTKDQQYGILHISMTTPLQGTFSARDDFIELYQK